jgi:hydroxyethylthiazole kinase-like uncharacterized protein yjeF
VSSNIILTAAEMRAAEARVIAAGTPVETLMERAGMAAAEAAWRFAGPLPTLVLCGPGNNGGDGYVIARGLKDRGVEVRVAALAEPATEAAKWARGLWDGLVEPLQQAAPATMLVDALFGTGLTRPLDPAVSAKLIDLAAASAVSMAVDLPSGVATNDGAILSPVPDCDLTVTFASLKPAHLLQPAARHMGRIVIADIGIQPESELRRIERPRLDPPGPDDHKYSRGYVAVVSGDMPGASALTAAGAARAGAGYVRLIGASPGMAIPAAIVQSASEANLLDGRIGAVAIGPGLGRDAKARSLLEQAFASGHKLVLDADALVLMAEGSPPSEPRHMPILTPHAGEFARLFGSLLGSKVEQAREAARRSNAVILFKGPDTVVAAPDGRAAISASGFPWLASAGTGDVLTGIIAAMRARGLDAFEAACAGAWLHGRAATLRGAGLIADDLIHVLPAALAECCDGV